VVLCAADHEDGGFLAAVHRQTGEIVWRRKRPAQASYATPRVMTLGGRAQVILSGCELVTSYDPRSGQELWTTPGTTQSTVGTAVAFGDLVLASGGYPGAETIALQPNGKVAWRIRDKSYVPSMTVVGTALYTVQDDGIAQCYDAKTGKTLWKQRIGGKFRTSAVVSAGHLIVTDMAGKTTVFAADPKAFRLIAENTLGNEAFASPAVSDGQLFLRVAEVSRGGRAETLYCLGERAAESRSSRSKTTRP
jgi:hypothetical protein